LAAGVDDVDAPASTASLCQDAAVIDRTTKGSVQHGD
jgi:hypothetical protein